MKKLIVTAIFFFVLFNLNKSLSAQSSVQIESLQRAIAMEQIQKNNYLEKIKQYKAALKTAADNWVILELREEVICSYPALLNTEERIKRLEKEIDDLKRIRQTPKPVVNSGTIKKARQ